MPRFSESLGFSSFESKPILIFQWRTPSGMGGSSDRCVYPVQNVLLISPQFFYHGWTMSEPNRTDKQEDLEQTVVMLEQILEVMPDDLFTLRALYETSLKLEQPEKAFKMLTRLDDASRAAQDVEMIDFALQQYGTIDVDSADVQSRISRLEEARTVASLLAGDQVPVATPGAQPAAEEEGIPSRIEAEMALAWDLFQDEQLSQDEYSSVLHDLTEMSTRQVGVPVTVLHVLHDRQFSRFERVVAHLCQKYSMPVMVLSQFENNEEVARAVPEGFSASNGLIPFASVGDDLLVGVLNPADRDLLTQAETVSGQRCHPYLVTPDEYDRYLAKSGQPLV